MNRNSASEKYKWNIGSLYKDKKTFESDLEIYLKNYRELQKYKGRLNDFDTFKEFFLESKKVSDLGNKINHYLKILLVEQNNALALENESLYYLKLQEFDGQFTWITEQIKEIGEETFLKWIKSDQDLMSYELHYQDFFKNLKYLLPEGERKLIAQVSNSSSMIYELYETLRFKDNKIETLTYKGKEYKLDQYTLSDVLTYSKPKEDQQLRIELSLAYKKNQKNKKFTLAKLYDSIVKEEVESTQLVGMKSFTENYFEDDNFSLDNYLSLIKLVSNNNQPYNDFYKLIKRYFQFDNKFYSTDSCLALANIEKKQILVEQGISILKKALSSLGSEYSEMLDLCIADNKIDFFEDDNKSSGAFTVYSNGYGSLVSLNYTDDYESISTLAHEIGHAVHNSFSEKYQKEPLNTFGNLIAEVSSTLNEHILFDYLIKESTDIQTKIVLIQNRIEFIISNFYSAVSESLFEYNCFKTVEKGDTLTLEKIISLLKQSSKEVLGESIFDKYNDEVIEYGWTSISHIFEQPFYIYKYAVSIAVSFKLYEDFKKTNDYTNILNYLKDGGSMKTIDLFKKYGFDPNEERAYVPLISYLKNLIEELELLLEKQKKSV